MNRQDRQNAISTALENGQHAAAGMMVEADGRLSAIEDVVAAGGGRRNGSKPSSIMQCLRSLKATGLFLRPGMAETMICPAACAM